MQIEKFIYLYFPYNLEIRFIIATIYRFTFQFYFYPLPLVVFLSTRSEKVRRLTVGCSVDGATLRRET